MSSARRIFNLAGLVVPTAFLFFSSSVFAANEIIVEVSLVKKASCVLLYSVDGKKSSKWNPDGRWSVESCSASEENGRFKYILRSVYPSTPSKLTELGFSYNNGNITRGSWKKLSVPFMKKRRVDINGQSFFDVYYARYSN